MKTPRTRLRASLLGLLLGLSPVLVVGSSASAAAIRPTVKFVTPVCVSAEDVSVNGVVNWRAGTVGTVTIDWGDGTHVSSPFPDAHTYAGPGLYTVTATVTNSRGSNHAATAVTVGPSSTSCADSISPQPMSQGGTLSPGQSTQVTVTVRNAAGKLRTQQPVWLSLTPAAGGGTATACCSPAGTTLGLGSTPTPFITGAATSPTPGQVRVTYTQPLTLPPSGTDTITAAPVPGASPPEAVSTTYQFSPTPVPLAPPSSIPSDCSVDVSSSLGPWFRNLPPHTTVAPAPGACYRVDEGLTLSFSQNLTIDGGTFENLATSPAPSNGHGTQRGSPTFNALGGSGLTLENMTISGVDSSGYDPFMAFAAGIVLQGTTNATISNVTINATYGDGITLLPLRNGANHKGSGIISATTNATISNVAITGPGRMGIAFVSVLGASVSNVTVDNVGLDTFDVEADQSGEGSQNVTINGCTAATTGPGDFFANGGSSSGVHTGNITVENCTMTEAQAGTAIWVNRPTTGTANRGPFLFDHDTFACGTSTLVTCVIVSGGTVTVQNSTLTFAGPSPYENVYTATLGSVLTFTNDTVAGFGSLGTNDSTSTVTTSGGTWTPGP